MTSSVEEAIKQQLRRLAPPSGYVPAPEGELEDRLANLEGHAHIVNETLVMLGAVIDDLNKRVGPTKIGL
jgi:hypothetical protein